MEYSFLRDGRREVDHISNRFSIAAMNSRYVRNCRALLLLAKEAALVPGVQTRSGAEYSAFWRRFCGAGAPSARELVSMQPVEPPPSSALVRCTFWSHSTKQAKPCRSQLAPLADAQSGPERQVPRRRHTVPAGTLHFYI